VQHVTLAVAIIQLTFAEKKQFLSELLVFPMLYAPFLVVLGLAVTGVFRLWLVATGQNKNPATGGDKFAENTETPGNLEKNGVANIVAMEIDDEVTDKWGIPVAKFHWKFSEHEINQVKHGLETAKKIFANMGADVGDLPAPEDAILKGGQIIHEVGATRMGEDPTDSVTNQWGQTWDCPNLFVMDAGTFASNPHKNCTLTILTLAMRNADWLAGQIKQGALSDE